MPKTLKVCDLASGRELRTLPGHSGHVNAVAVTPDLMQAVSASEDQTLKVWDLATGTVIATFTCDAPARCCVFAGDGSGRVHFLSLELKDGN